MIDKNIILQKLIAQFGNMGAPLGFSAPFIHMQDGFVSHLYMRRKGHGLKMEILWHEGVVFVGVVRLINGEPPAKEFGSNGRWCGKYIQEIYGIPPVKKRRKQPLAKNWEETDWYLSRSLEEKIDLVLGNPKALLDYLDGIA